MDKIGEFLQRDLKIALLLFTIAGAVGCTSILILDFALLSFSGIICQVGILFYLGWEKFKIFFDTPDKKTAGSVAIMGDLISFSGYFRIGALI